MSIAFQYDAILREGIIDPYDPNAKWVEVQLSINGLSFTGGVQTFSFGNKVMFDDRGYELNIPLSKIKEVYQSKFKILHFVTIETVDDHAYTLVLSDRLSYLGKKHVKAFLSAYEKLISSLITCPECGHYTEKGKKFCSNCGKQQ